MIIYISSFYSPDYFTLYPFRINACRSTIRSIAAFLIVSSYPQHSSLSKPLKGELNFLTNFNEGENKLSTLFYFMLGRFLVTMNTFLFFLKYREYKIGPYINLFRSQVSLFVLGMCFNKTTIGNLR